jgi:hypothetical protein
MLLTFALCCSAAHHQATIPAGSKVYVDSKDGLELDKLLIAAFQARHVPLQIVSSPENAEYTLHCAVTHWVDSVTDRSQAVARFNITELDVNLTSSRVDFPPVNADDIVWKYFVTGRVAKQGGKPAAEAIAKRIKGVVAKGPKP